MIKRVLIAQRGASAVRIMQTCRELGLQSVAVYSKTDRLAQHVRYADHAYGLDGAYPHPSDLRAERIIEIAIAAGADAVHPGDGPLATSAAFARRCTKAGLIFIGPQAETLERLSDKTGARRIAQDLGLPVLEDGVCPRDGATAKVVEPVRHIQVQILGDRHGRILHLGEWECTIRFRQHKLLIESPALALDETLRSQVCAAALRFGRALGYVGVGSVEFVLDPNCRFYFVGAHPCLQAEHPVIEMVTGVNLVCEQLRIAAGRALHYRQEDVPFRGAAIACRLLVVDVMDLVTGRVTHLTLPGGPGIRVDSGVFEGAKIGPHSDPLLLKVSAWGETRDVAILRAQRALRELQLSGVPSNLSLLMRLLDRICFANGVFDSGLVDASPHKPETKRAQDRVVAALAVALLRHHGDGRARPDGGERRTSVWKQQGRWEMME